MHALQLLVYGVLIGSIYAVVALGFSLVYRVTGVVNLAQGAFCLIGAVLAYALNSVFGAMLPAALVAVLATTAIGALMGWLIFVPAVMRLPPSSMLMLTAGLLTFLSGAVLVLWGNDAFTLPRFSDRPPVALFGVTIPSQSFWIVGMAALTISGLWYLLNRTRLGRALRACADNPTAARLMGIDVRRMALLSFTLAAMIGAVGGVVMAPLLSLEYGSGNGLTLSGFIALAIGGMTSFLGSIVGGLLLGITEQFSIGYVSAVFSRALALCLLLAVLLWRPNGLFPSKVHRREDVNHDPRIHRGIVRLRGRPALASAGATLALLGLAPWVLGDSGMLESLVIAAILFIAVLGLDVMMGYTGEANLGQAGFMAIGGYASAVLCTDYDWSPLAALLAGLGLSAAAALLLGVITSRLRGIYFVLATLAFGLLVDSLATGLDVTGGPSGVVGIPAFAIGPIAFDTPVSIYYLVLAIIVVLLVVLFGAMNGDFGRALQAIRADRMAAAALGVNVQRHRMAVFVISALLGSLSGSLLAYNFHFLSPEMVGTSRSFEMIAMLVIGGEGTLVGPAIGVLLLTLLPTMFQPLAAYKVMMQGLLIMIGFSYLPEGIFGAVVRKLQALAPNRSRPRLLLPQAGPAVADAGKSWSDAR